MEAGQTGGGKGIAKASVGHPLVKRCAGLCSENKSVGIIPHGPGFKLLLRLPYPLSLQRGEYSRRRGDGPGSSILRGLERPLCAEGGADQLFVDADRAVVKVYRIPGEAQQFRLTQAREQSHGKKVLDIGSYGGGQQGGGLFVIERVDLRLLRAGELTPRRRVSRYVIQLHGLFQGGMQYLVMVTRCRWSKPLQAVDKGLHVMGAELIQPDSA